MEKEQNDLIRFRYETDDDNKMDLSVFVESLNGISDSYKTFLSKTEYKDIPQSLKIVEIRHKCIEIDLQSIAQNIAPVLLTENLNTGIEFFKRLYECCKFFYSLIKDKDVQPPSLQESQQIKKIIKPIANGQAKQFNGCIINGDINININIDNTSASKMDANIDDHIKTIETESSSTHEKVLLTIHQARNSTENSGDKSIVSEISKSAVKTTFESPHVKNQMLHPSSGNPFDQKYLVDINVTYKNNKPVEYRIFKLWEIIPMTNTDINQQTEFDFEDNQTS